MDGFYFQRDHYKSDWHRYNLKLKLKALNSVTEEDFEKIAGKTKH